MKYLQSFFSMFSLKKVNAVLEDGIGPSYIAFITATVMRWCEKIESLHWVYIACIFILYKMIKKYIIPLIRIGGAVVGIKDLEVVEIEDKKSEG